MSLYNLIKNKKEKISLIGLGYVGMPIAVAFAKKVDVIGFDISEEKIEQYKKGFDPTNEVGEAIIKETSVEFTSNPNKIKEAKFHIVAVPTPLTKDKTPDLKPIESASRVVGQNLMKGSIVVFESTVYPGVTEEICIPILENESGLRAGIDFKVGYSPERINPGDKVHRLETIIKVVSAMDEESLEEISKVYELVVDAGVYKAESIKVAEAAKVIENSQRDINIAFMNELSIIFNKLDIDTNAVLKAASTKWNFLNFSPGLVGGHCIGIDPYYLTYKAEQAGYQSQIILAGRRINDNMGKYIVENLVKNLIEANINVQGAKVAILGFTFKENVPDTRNTKIIDIIEELKEYKIQTVIVDPVADANEAKNEYGIEFVTLEEVKDVDAVIIAVGHDKFTDFSPEKLSCLYKDTHNKNKVLIDIKAIMNKKEFLEASFKYWSL